MTGKRKVIANCMAVAVFGLITASPALSQETPREGKPIIDAPLGPGLTMEQVQQNAVVDKYVLSTKAKFPQMSPSVEWEEGLIKFAAKAPIPEALLTLDGDRVDTLTVQVMESRFSESDYDLVLKRLTGSGKAWGRKVYAVEMPADMQSIPVQYEGLEFLGEAARSSLKAEMSQVAGLPITLVARWKEYW